MKMIRIIPHIFAAFLLYGCSEDKTVSISDSSLFVSKQKETYQCVRLRRGDKIALEGKISVVDQDGEEKILLTTNAGRKFILSDKGKGAGLTALSGQKIKIRSIIVFEGNEEQLPVLTVTGFN